MRGFIVAALCGLLLAGAARAGDKAPKPSAAPQSNGETIDAPQQSQSNPPNIGTKQLEGLLVVHDGIRRWIELKLDKPTYDKTSVELIPSQNNLSHLEIFRDCRVKSSGAVDFSPTGYYSSDIFQNVERIDPSETCLKQMPFPDYSVLKPEEGILAYRVDMHVNYRPGDHPIIFHVTSAGRELRPWQAYAGYSLTGGYVLYGYCGKGFVIDKVFGTPQAEPSHFDDPRTPGDMAAFDPERAAQSGKWDLHLGYTCIRGQ